MNPFKKRQPNTPQPPEYAERIADNYRQRLAWVWVGDGNPPPPITNPHETFLELVLAAHCYCRIYRFDPDPDAYYGFELPHNTTPGATLAARMVCAVANNDHPHAYALWLAAGRHTITDATTTVTDWCADGLNNDPAALDGFLWYEP